MYYYENGRRRAIDYMQEVDDNAYNDWISQFPHDVPTFGAYEQPGMTREERRADLHELFARIHAHYVLRMYARFIGRHYPK